MNKLDLITIYNKMIKNNINIKSLTINYNTVYNINDIDVIEYLNQLQDISSYNMTFNIEHNTQRDDKYMFIHDDWKVINIIFHGEDNQHQLMVDYLSNYNLLSSSSSQLIQLFDNPYSQNSQNIKNKFNIKDINSVINYIKMYIELMENAVKEFKSIKNKFSGYFY
jgi:hypothetical protein